MLLFAGRLAGIIGRRVGMKWPLAAGLVCIAGASGSLAVSGDADHGVRPPDRDPVWPPG